jgi:peptidoglycan/xylan/chitin deacetylase (PgdA/CDA1 family)
MCIALLVALSGGFPSAAGTAQASGKLTPQDLQRYQPNELAPIPVMEYHVITTDESRESDVYVRTAEHMREDLQWLYDHNFHVISTRSLLENRIDVPAGKKPVILSFDDATASQFRWDPHGQGGEDVRLIDPDTAMGVLEAFFQGHPDFGRGGQFAVLPYNCFADGTPLNTIDDCPDKLRWMAANGYEIANHTQTHANLYDVTDEEFMAEIGEPIVWLSDIVQGDANLMDVLVMPYGMYPDKDLHPEQREMLRNGFTYKGHEIQIRGAFLVGANPTESPSSSEYDPLFISRIQAFEESLDQWFGEMGSGSYPVYVSDGDPATITIPDALPNMLIDQFDPAVVTAGGHQLIQYEPETGEIVSPS